MFESSHKKLNKKFNWAGNIIDSMCKYIFNDIWISQDVVEFMQRVIDCFVSEAVAFFEDSPNCNFYRYIYDIHQLQFYLSRHVNYMHN